MCRNFESDLLASSHTRLGSGRNSEDYKMQLDFQDASLSLVDEGN